MKLADSAMTERGHIPFQIKGNRDGLLVTIGDGEWNDLQHSLIEHVEGNAGFFQGARLALDVGNRVLHAAELGALRDVLSDHSITLWAVLSNAPSTEQNAQALGLATRLPVPRQGRLAHIQDAGQVGENAVMLHRTLRSGFKLSYQGHVVVLGDVNPGAEIVASGSVVVWGRLRGLVHAGAQGDENATVCALDMSPTQLRIAEKIVITPAQKGKGTGFGVGRVLSMRRSQPQPEMARIRDGRVVVEPWTVKAKS